ncbi:MAG: hypothetical protein ACP5MC_03535, partial [Candidatus Micrarchaeia archaeon]
SLYCCRAMVELFKYNQIPVVVVNTYDKPVSLALFSSLQFLHAYFAIVTRMPSLLATDAASSFLLSATTTTS